MLLAGDNHGAAGHLATEAGITDAHAGLLPKDKVKRVRTTQATGPRVLLVGDGVNDAPALAAADLGVAMGRGGSDLALHSADAVLVRDDLATRPATITYPDAPAASSRRTSSSLAPSSRCWSAGTTGVLDLYAFTRRAASAELPPMQPRQRRQHHPIRGLQVGPTSHKAARHSHRTEFASPTGSMSCTCRTTQPTGLRSARLGSLKCCNTGPARYGCFR